MNAGDVTLEQVADLAASVASVTDRLDPDAIPDGEVRAVIESLAAIKRRVDGAVTLMARRAADGSGEGPKGTKAAAAYLARTTGTSTSAARKQLATSTKLASQTGTTAAVRTGRLSDAQAAAIAEVAAVDPSAQDDLIERAGVESLDDLRRTCRDRHAAADPDRDSRRRRHHARRSCRTWTETDGEWRAVLSGPADLGARFDAALRADHDRIFKDAHAGGRREPDAAYHFDALIDVLERGAATRPAGDVDRTGTGETHGSATSDGGPVATTPRRAGRQTQVVVNVSLSALTRGTVDPDETCRIEGVGEVSLAAARALSPDAHLAYVIRDGVDIRSVVHLGRQATAHQRTAMLARGYECEVPHCRSTHLLEIDHVRDWAFSGRTVLDELAWLCRDHHARKSAGTHHLDGPPGRRRWVTDVGHEISRDPPRPDPPRPDPPRPVEQLAAL